jgi:hypothetical protein
MAKARRRATDTRPKRIEPTPKEKSDAWEGGLRAGRLPGPFSARNPYDADPPESLHAAAWRTLAAIWHEAYTQGLLTRPPTTEGS